MGRAITLKLAGEGADVAINVRKIPHSERVKIIKDLTAGRGADVVVETAGTAHAAQQPFRLSLAVVRNTPSTPVPISS